MGPEKEQTNPLDLVLSLYHRSNRFTVDSHSFIICELNTLALTRHCSNAIKWKYKWRCDGGAGIGQANTNSLQYILKCGHRFDHTRSTHDLGISNVCVVLSYVTSPSSLLCHGIHRNIIFFSMLFLRTQFQLISDMEKVFHGN